MPALLLMLDMPGTILDLEYATRCPSILQTQDCAHSKTGKYRALAAVEMVFLPKLLIMIDGPAGSG